MSCPYFKESYFGICVAQDAIHVPSIDEMERFCFRSWYSTCPNISCLKNPEKSGKPCTKGGRHNSAELLAWPPFALGKDRDTA
jgi:hypothetical protein